MSGFFRKNGWVILGGMIQGLGMGLFLFPHAIPSGGAGGIAVLLNYMLEIDMGLALWIVNFSMLVLAIKYLGHLTALWTVLSITVTSFSVTFFQRFFIIPIGYVWLDLLAGSILLGLGVGILLRQGVSNGGVGVIALIIANARNTLPGRPLFWINGFIFIITASIISWEIIIQALISQWISTKIVDLVCHYQFHTSYTLDWRKK